LAPKLEELFELAGDDAARRGETEIHSENLFIAILRGPRLPLQFLSGSGVDLERLHEIVADRLHPANDRVARPKLPFDDEVRGVIERAVAIADERRRAVVTSLQILAALAEREAGFASDLISACGGDLARLRERLARS
jgi:ATP-dependent Clp protease ATP-binding subunit ClpA